MKKLKSAAHRPLAVYNSCLKWLRLLLTMMHSELNDIEKLEIVQSEDFTHFFGKAARTLERAMYLSEKYNIARDFIDDDRRSTSGYLVLISSVCTSSDCLFPTVNSMLVRKCDTSLRCLMSLYASTVPLPTSLGLQR